MLLLAAGCGQCGGQSSTPESETTEPAVEEPATQPPREVRVGTLRGVVRLAPGAEVPAYTEAQLFGDASPGPRPEACGPPQRSERQPVRLSEDRGLSNIAIVVIGEDPNTFGDVLPEREPVEHRVAIRNCRLHPPTVVATRGDELVLVNEMDHPFLPTLGSSNFMRGLRQGEEHKWPLDRGGIVPLRCGFGSVCGRADVAVAFFPVNGVTDELGQFEITNAPTHQQLQVTTAHPLFQEAVVTTRVGVGEAVEVEITLHPNQTAEPAAAEPIEGHPEDQPATSSRKHKWSKPRHLWAGFRPRAIRETRVVCRDVSSGAKARLLVVDDSRSMRAKLTEFFQENSMEVLTAANGAEALELLDREGPFDLVLLDQIMPEMDGLETLERIRTSYSKIALPVLMATSRSESADVVAALEKGANDYVIKPLDLLVTLARVEAQISVARQAKGSQQWTVVATDGSLPAGVTINGRYELRDVIGRGGLPSCIELGS